MQARECFHCKGSYTPTQRKQICCSKSCYDKYWYRNKGGKKGLFKGAWDTKLGPQTPLYSPKLRECGECGEMTHNFRVCPKCNEGEGWLDLL